MYPNLVVRYSDIASIPDSKPFPSERRPDRTTVALFSGPASDGDQMQNGLKLQNFINLEICI